MAFPTKHTMTIILLSLSLFEACKSAETTPADQVALGLNKSARVGDITIHVDSLQEIGSQRSPFAYNAFISAVVSTTTARQRVQLSLLRTSSRPDSAGVTLSGQTYKVLLRDVIPHQDLGSIQQGERQAVIQITKL